MTTWNNAESDAYLSLSGTSGNYASTPDSATNSITGDIDIRVLVALDDWTPAANAVLVAKYSPGNQRSYFLSVQSDGTLITAISADGITPIFTASTVATGFTDGAAKWVRATIDVNNGAGGNTHTFYTSDDGETWTQLGAAVTNAGTTSVFDSTAVLEIGSLSVGTTNILAGKIYRAQVYNGIDGTLVADFNADDANPGDTSVVSSATGETWTINGTAAIVSDTTAWADAEA